MAEELPKVQLARHVRKVHQAETDVTTDSPYGNLDVEHSNVHAAPWEVYDCLELFGEERGTPKQWYLTVTGQDACPYQAMWWPGDSSRLA